MKELLKSEVEKVAAAGGPVYSSLKNESFILDIWHIAPSLEPLPSTNPLSSFLNIYM